VLSVDHSSGIVPPVQFLALPQSCASPCNLKSSTFSLLRQLKLVQQSFISSTIENHIHLLTIKRLRCIFLFFNSVPKKTYKLSFLFFLIFFTAHKSGPTTKNSLKQQYSQSIWRVVINPIPKISIFLRGPTVTKPHTNKRMIAPRTANIILGRVKVREAAVAPAPGKKVPPKPPTNAPKIPRTIVATIPPP